MADPFLCGMGASKARFGGIVLNLMSDYVMNDGWCKPRAVPNDLRLINEPEYLLNHRREDRVEWTLTANKEYSMKSAWRGIRNVGDNVR
ncbi:hypothetical protein LguiA_027372 [Lonicera macranthoides]